MSAGRDDLAFFALSRAVVPIDPVGQRDVAPFTLPVFDPFLQPDMLGFRVRRANDGIIVDPVSGCSPMSERSQEDESRGRTRGSGRREQEGKQERDEVLVAEHLVVRVVMPTETLTLVPN